MAKMTPPLSIIMQGASGAVGSQVVNALLAMPEVETLTLLNRRKLDAWSSPKLRQHVVDVLDPATYRHLIPGHRIAISTLGVGEPSHMSKAEFVRIDKDAVLDFAKACKQAGLAH